MFGRRPTLHLPTSSSPLRPSTLRVFSTTDDTPYIAQWCYHGWHELREHTIESAKRFPGIVIRPLDPSRPLLDQVSDAHVLIPTTGPVTGEVIRAASKCRLITQPAVSLANVDIPTASELRIPVCNAPGANAQSTAEIAILHVLYIACRLPERIRVFQEGQNVGTPLAWELKGKTLGIIGISGAIGQIVARTFRALGMRVIGTNSKSSREELEELLRCADVVSLHLPLNAATRHMISRAELAMMKPNAVLINTSRADIIDKEALQWALEEGMLGGVGLDVFWEEPADPSESLYRHPKMVLCTPHVGVASEETYVRLGDFLVDNIERVRRGRAPLNAINAGEIGVETERRRWEDEAEAAEAQAGSGSDLVRAQA